MAVDGVMGTQLTPFCITPQPVSVFPLTNGIGDHPGMDNARRNIRHLMNGRSENEIGNATGVGQTWLNRYLSGEIKKGNESKLVALARYFEVPVARLVYEDLTGTAPAPASQPAGLDAPTLLRTLDFLDELFREHGKTFVAAEQVELVTAVYDELMTAPDTKPVRLTVKYGKALEGGDEGQREDASADADGDRSDRGRTTATKVATGRAR